MIGGIGRHGRTGRDAKNLASHLLKDRGAAVEILNSAAPDLRAAMADMQLARDASRADSAFLHAYLSPSRDMSRDELRQAAQVVLRHFGAEDHQAALVFHDKPRRSGEGNSHVHIVVGRVGPDGQVLPAGFEKIRLETACRIIEHDLKEQPTLGRHHASAVKWCRKNGREDVARWLETAYGRHPSKPTSVASPDKRQALERQGVVLGTVRETVVAAWTASDSPKAFAAAMAAEGIQIAPGEKAGVFVVSVGGIEVGALDRIVKQKRREVAAKMEGFENVSAAETKAAGREGDLRRDGQGLQKSGGLAALALAPRRAGAEGGRADRGHPDLAGNGPDQPAPASPVARRPAQQGRRIEQAAAVRQLSQVRLSPAAMRAMQDLRARSAKPASRFESFRAARELDGHADGWGWLRTLGDRLVNRARRTYDQVRAFRIEQERERQAREIALRPKPSPRSRPRPEPEPEYVYSGPRM